MCGLTKEDRKQKVPVGRLWICGAAAPFWFHPAGLVPQTVTYKSPQSPPCPLYLPPLVRTCTHGPLTAHFKFPNDLLGHICASRARSHHSVVTAQLSSREGFFFFFLSAPPNLLPPLAPPTPQKGWLAHHVRDDSKALASLTAGTLRPCCASLAEPGQRRGSTDCNWCQSHDRSQPPPLPRLRADQSAGCIFYYQSAQAVLTSHFWRVSEPNKRRGLFYLFIYVYLFI